MVSLDDKTRAWLIMQLKPDRVEAGGLASAGVETGAICNLRCPACYTGRGAFPLDKEFLSLDSFARVLDGLGPRLKFLSLLRWGEPLLNPDIFAMVRLASSRGIDTLIHSNFSLPAFDEKAALALVSSGLGELSVSCDGASQRTYQKYRVGGRLTRVLRNLLAVLKAKRRLASELPRVRWQFLVHRGNQHETAAAEEMARRLGVKIEFRKIIVPTDGAADAGAVEEGSAPGRDFFEYQPCLQAWDMPGVHSDGSVLPCCAVVDRRYGLGNILREPIQEIWNKPLIVAMRRYLRSGVKSGLDLPCYGCPRDPNKNK